MFIKRVFALLLIITLLLPVLIAGGLTAHASYYQNPRNPFEFYDKLRDDYIKGKTPDKNLLALPAPGSDSKAYIISFYDYVPLEEIYDAVSIYDFTLLAYSKERKFLVRPDSIEKFVSVHSEIIEYAIPDKVVYTLYEENEPVDKAPAYWELEAIGATPELTSGGNGVIVAILDSGINRNHDYLSHATILEGYNAVTGEIGVYDDELGHGTRVTGIIVSSVSGVAKGATILPVKITTDGRSILTSSLVGGIYYAADYGADVINMSFGGYDENKAERDAVEYAASKGCILVAAAGNEGRDMGYAGRYSYPASYDSVISVASSRRDGTSCVFSQYNDRVDIAAPGEDLTVVTFTEGEPDTAFENGTSYSAAFISGAAALAVYNSPRKLNSAAFGKLLEYSAVNKRNDHLGWGVINLHRLMDNLSKPVVYGVSDGLVYFEEVKAVFENAAATLDGEEYLSGESIYSQGKHTIIVTDEFGSVTINFTVDPVKLNYTIERNDDYVIIKFTRGTALVDGQPYQSGTPITGFGQHTFVLTGPYGNTVSESFFISTDIPAVFGVEKGKVYNTRLEIMVIGDGYAFLDGVEIKDSVIVTTPGEHTLLRSDYAGVKYSELTFFITDTGIEELGYAPGGRVIYNKELNWIAFWDNNQAGIKVYRPNELSRIQRYVLTTDKVVSLSIDGGRLVAVTKGGFLVLDASLLISNKNPLIYEFSSPFEVINGIAGGGNVFLLDEYGTVYTYSYEGTLQAELDTSSDETKLFAKGGYIYAYSVYYPKTVYIFNNGIWGIKSPEVVPGGDDIYASGSTVFIGDMAYDDTAFGLKYQINGYHKVIFCDESVFIAGNKLFSVTNGVNIGIYPQNVVSAYKNGNILYIVYEDKTIEKVVPTGLYGAAPVNTAITGNMLATRSFEYTVPLAVGSKITDAAFDNKSGSVIVLKEGDNRLYYLNTKNMSLDKTVHLKYVPSSLIKVEGGVAVLFTRVNKVYLTATGEYISFPARVSSVSMWNGRLFAICGGRVCEYEFATGDVVYPFGDIYSDGLACYGGRLYISTVYDLTGYDIKTYTPFASKQAMFSGNVMAFENYVIAGNSVYDANTLEYVSAVEGKLYAFSGNALFTENGLFSVPAGEYITGYRSSPKLAVILPDMTTLLFNEMSVVVINSQGFDPTKQAVVTGVAEGGVYYGGASIWFDRGNAYVDGKKIQSGYIEKQPGKHTLTVVTAWNVYTVINFTVKYDPEAIVFQNSEIWLGVGQTVTLKVKILPEGAEGVITFATESDNITLTPLGTVTALAPGEGVVTAQIAGTHIQATCIIHVTESRLICTNPNYNIDDGNGIISGIDTNTDIYSFLSYFIADDCSYQVTDVSGREIFEGIVSTGMRINRYDNFGKLTKTLVISVKGDLDGDGIASLADADMLYRHLLLNTQLDDYIFRAADLNQNSRVTLTDLKALRQIMDYSAKGEESEMDLFIHFPLFGYTGTEFYATIQNDKLGKATSLAGLVTYDESYLTVSRIVAFGGEVYTTQMPGRLEYSILGIDGFSDKSKLLRIYFTVKSDAPAGDTPVYFDSTTAAAGEKLYSVNTQREVFTVKTTPAEKLTITSANAYLNFNPEVFEYNLVIPEEDNYLDINYECPAGCFVYFNNLPVYDNPRRLTLTYLNKSGEIFEYVFNISRGKVVFPDNNSRLLTLDVLGCVLSPEFDQSITEYNAIVNYGSMAQIIALPESAGANVEITGPATLSVGENVFTIICTAEDGSQTAYTVTITMLSEDESGDESSSEEPSGESSDTVSSRDETTSSSESSENQSSSGQKGGFDRRNRRRIGYMLIAVGSIALSIGIVMAVRKKKE